MVLYRGDLSQVVLNSSTQHGDIMLVSSDRRYFLANRIVLISACDLIDKLLAASCEFCGDLVDEHVVVFCEGFSGETLKSFLSLVYSGVAAGIDDAAKEKDLRQLCNLLQLKGFESLTHEDDLREEMACYGFDEVESLRIENTHQARFMLPPKSSVNHQAHDVEGLDAPNLKMEPEEQDDAVDYYGAMDDHLSSNSRYHGGQGMYNDEQWTSKLSATSSLFYKCPNCPREFHNMKRYEKHLRECYIPKKKMQEKQGSLDDDDMALLVGEAAAYMDSDGDGDLYEPETMLETRDPDVAVFECDGCLRKFHRNNAYEKHIQDCAAYNEMSTDDDDDDDSSSRKKGGKGKRKNCPRAKVDYKYEERDGRVFCLHPECVDRNQSSRYLHGFQEHWLTMHTTEEERTFPCSYCTLKFASNSLRNKHEKNLHMLPFECTECGKKFCKKSILMAHMNTHSGEKPFKCDQCTAEFASPSGLQYHVGMYHSMEKKHSCDECGASFRFKASLKRHIHFTHESRQPIRLPAVEGQETSEGLTNEANIKREVDLEEEEDEEYNEEEEVEEEEEDEETFVCDACGADFKTERSLAKHTQLHHSGHKRHKCDECGKAFRLKSTLRKHQITHEMKEEENMEVVAEAIDESEDKSVMHRTPKIDYLMKEENDRMICLHPDCVDRNISFRWKNGIQEHWLEKHISEEEKPYACQYCSKRFGSNALRNRHIKFSHVLRYKCKLCQKKFATKQILQAHMRVHSGEKPFVCEDCGLSFAQKSNLRQHTNVYHSNIKKFECKECSVKFKTRNMLKKHMMHHQVSKEIADYQIPPELEFPEEPKVYLKVPKIDYPFKILDDGRYHCTIQECMDKGISFQWINGLREHYMDKHATDDQKCFPCHFCGKLFGTNGLRNKHEGMAHELRFECTQCEKKFGKKSMLLDHMRTHTGEKPYVCETCGADFYSRGSLNAHIRQRHQSKDAVKNFHCQQCGKSFFMSFELNRHMRNVHTDTRSFVCDECGKSYKVANALRRHKEFHSGKTYSCEPCNLTFHSNTNYRRHQKRKHPGQLKK